MRLQLLRPLDIGHALNHCVIQSQMLTLPAVVSSLLEVDNAGGGDAQVQPGDGRDVVTRYDASSTAT